MLPLNLWEHQSGIKALYAKCVEDVCARHRLTRMELDILLFLANNPRFDTATELVERRFLSKSQVSLSLKRLEARGWLRREYLPGNRKTAHLRILPSASGAITDGQAVQEQFIQCLFRGFTLQEREALSWYHQRMLDNINFFLREDS